LSEPRLPYARGAYIALVGRVVYAGRAFRRVCLSPCPLLKVLSDYFNLEMEKEDREKKNELEISIFPFLTYPFLEHARGDDGVGQKRPLPLTPP